MANEILPAEREAPNLTPRDRLLNRVVDCMEYVNSYAISATQAAWRGDETNLEVNLKAIRVILMEAIRVFKELTPLPVSDAFKATLRRPEAAE